MNHWLILILSAIAMVAILVVFMWWWTTDNWDWASAELKPPRTVNTHPTEPGGLILLQPGEPLPTFPSGPTLEQRVKNLDYHLLAVEECWEQRVTALEEKMPEDMNLHLDQLFSRLQIMERKLDGYLEDSPSPPTASPTTDSPSDAVQETTGVWTPQSWQLDPRITPGGPVGFGSEFAEPEDVLT